MRTFVLLTMTLLAAVLGAGFLLPAEVVVERSITVNRPASTVFTVLNGFRTWPEWSPWAALDPSARFERTGPDTGVGARLHWQGDPALVGTGSQEIVASRPFELIELHTDIAGQGVARTTYEVQGDQLGSRVRWIFRSDVTEGRGMLGGLLNRWFGLFLSRWVGDDFERGLARLKAFAERLPARDFSGADLRLVQAEALTVAKVEGTSEASPEAIAAALAEAFGEITAWALDNDVPLGDRPLAVTREAEQGAYRFTAAIPLAVPDAPLPRGTGRVETGVSPAGPAARIVHIGPFDDTLASYEKLYAWMAAHGYQAGEVSWEHYITDPGTTPPEAWVTHINVLLDPASPPPASPASEAHAAPDNDPGR